MKFLIFIVIFFLLKLNFFGQNTILPILKDGKWGAIDIEFNTILPMIYNSVIISKSGAVIVKKDSLYGLLSSDGKRKITDILYSRINADNQYYFTTKKNNKFILFNYSGSMVLDSQYSEIEIINQKLIKIKKNGLYTLLDIDSKKTIGYYNEIIPDDYNYFILKKNKLECLYIPEKQYKSAYYKNIEIKRNNLVFFYETSKTWILDIDKNFETNEVERPYYFEMNENYYLYSIGKTNIVKNTITKKTENIEIDSIKIINIKKKQKNTISSFISNNEEFWYVYRNGKIGILNSKCEIIIPAIFSKISFSKNKFYVETEKYKGLYSKTGKIMVPPIYSHFYREVNLYIVKKNKKYGVINKGIEVIPTHYDFIKSSLNDMFLVRNAGKYGVINMNNKKILSTKYNHIKIFEKSILFEKGNNNGIAGLDGEIKINTPNYKFYKLNDNFFRLSKNNKYGIIDINGNGIFKPKYRFIKNSGNSNIFYVSSFEYNDLSNKWGLVNSHGEILLDTLYYIPQIEEDFTNNYIKVPADNGEMLVVTFEENGKIIDKIKYKNYVAAKIRKQQKNKNFWRRGGKYKLLGLFSAKYQKLIDYAYSSYNQNFMNNKEFVLTIIKTSSKKNKFPNYTNLYGIVNQTKGLVLLPAKYPVINIDDFKKAKVARCFDQYGKAVLINQNCEIVKKNFGFVDDFSENYTRANKKGKMIDVKSKNNKYILQVPGFDYSGLKKYFSATAICKNGKWGILDNTGDFIVGAKYEFLQKYFRNEFIAQKNKKWGVISPEDSVKIDFIYDEIRYFFDDSLKNRWANIPYYKVKIKGKWGVIDSIGNIIVDTKFDEIDYIYNDDIFFITKINFKENIYGYIDTTGFVKIEHNFYEAGKFKNGWASIKLGKHKYTFINKSCKKIGEIIFQEVCDFRENVAAVKINGKWGFIDTTGGFIVKPEFLKIGNFGNGLAPIFLRKKSRFGFFRSYIVCGFINKKGKQVIKAKFKKCTDFNNGFSIIKKKYYGIIDIKGNYLVKPKFRKIIYDRETKNFIIIDKKRRYALLSPQGDFIVPFGKYIYIGKFSDGLCIVRKRSGAGYIDKKGRKKIECNYIDAKNFSEGLAAVRNHRAWGYIDTSANVKINFNFSKAGNFTAGIATVMKKYKYGKININKKGIKVSSIASKRIYKDVFLVKAKNKKYGLIDKNRDPLFVPFAEKINNFSEGLAAYGIKNLFGLYDKNGNCIAKTKSLLINPIGNKIFMVQNINEIRYCK